MFEHIECGFFPVNTVFRFCITHIVRKGEFVEILVTIPYAIPHPINRVFWIVQYRAAHKRTSTFPFVLLYDQWIVAMFLKGNREALCEPSVFRDTGID